VGACGGGGWSQGRLLKRKGDEPKKLNTQREGEQKKKSRGNQLSTKKTNGKFTARMETLSEAPYTGKKKKGAVPNKVGTKWKGSKIGQKTGKGHAKEKTGGEAGVSGPWVV